MKLCLTLLSKYTLDVNARRRTTKNDTLHIRRFRYPDSCSSHLPNGQTYTIVFQFVFSTQNIFVSRTLLDEVVSFEIINETFTVEVNVLRQ